ncbi:hypothetical protein KAU04_05710 [bacterium]|nr:hypothetical protein [bacterium]
MRRKQFQILKLFLVFVVVLSAKTFAQTSTKTTIYGYIKLDASYDEAKVKCGNFAFFVLDEPKNDQFNMTARQSRLGMKFEGPSTDNVKVFGNVEIDFYGGGTENKPNPMLRQAYMELRYTSFSLLAGQTWDLFAPLVPTNLNYAVMCMCGNTGHRRPQVRATKSIDIGENSKFTAGLSVNRSIGRGEDGEDSGLPAEEGRIAFSQRLFGQKFATIGISGLWGQEKSDILQKEFDQRGLAIDLSIPFGEKATLQGEYFTGKNLASYTGGVGQGIDETNEKEIEASGGWGHLSIVLNENAKMNLGAGIDDPDISENDTCNTRDENLAVFGNIIWKLNPAVSIGVEYIRMKTTYLGRDSFENNRGQISFIYFI